MSSYFDEFFKKYETKRTAEQQAAVGEQRAKQQMSADACEKPQSSAVVVYQAERLAYPFAAVAFAFFCVQGMVSNAGALEVVFPDIPSPIPFTAGRSFHVNISLYWPLIGMMGGIYYLFCREANQDIFSPKLVKANFWLMTLAVLAILGSIILGFNEGREYLEAVKPLKAAVAVSLILLLYNVARTYTMRQVPGTRATLVSILAGIFSLIIFYLPNLINYVHPTVDELIKFWVVHLWEEMSMELLGVGIQTALLLAITGGNRQVLEGLLYLDMALIVLAGILATGHHYYWVGFPAVWLWVGGAFSAVQVIPAVLLLITSLKTVDQNTLEMMGQREKITLALIACSVFYHIFGAGLLGLAMAYPGLNRYVHGTYITSAHSHLALFGVFGFLALAVSFYMLLGEISFSKADYHRCWLSIAAINVGLIVMGTALILAGGLQAYLLRVIGLTTTEVNGLIRPYLMLRVAGGLSYTAGTLFFAWLMGKNVWRNRRLLFSNNDRVNNQRQLLRQVKSELEGLVLELKEAQKQLNQLKAVNQRSIARLKVIVDNNKKKL